MQCGGRFSLFVIDGGCGIIAANSPPPPSSSPSLFFCLPFRISLSLSPTSVRFLKGAQSQAAAAAAAEKIDRFEKRGRYGEKVGEAGSGGGG